MHLRLFVSLLIIVASPSIHAAKKSNKMVIPERREFPLNTAVNPCEDFYKYSCSKTIDAFELPADRSRHIFSFNDSGERILEAKKKYFTELTKAKPQSEREGMLKDYYVACMDSKAREKEEKQLVKERIAKVKALTTREALLDLFAEGRLQGEESPVGFWTTSNLDRPLFNDVIFYSDWMTLPEKSFYEKPEVMKDFEKLAVKFYTSAGLDNPAGRAKVLLRFERELAKVYPLPAEFRNLFSSRTSIERKDVLKSYPNLRLAALVDRVPEKTTFRHVIPEAMAFLNTELGQMPFEDLKTVYLYFALNNVMDDAYPGYFKTKFAFEADHFGGPAKRPARGERCTQQVMRIFTPELDSILWVRMFPDFPVEKVTELSEKIRLSIVASLKNNNWLSSSARKEAINKVTKANLQVVAPKNDEEWDFSPIMNFDLKRPIENRRQYDVAMTDKSLNELKGPISPLRWGMGPLTVNAYYSASFNKFVLPVGILQYPFFDVKGPMELNLAAIGTVIGHELGHGIDDKGSRYDSKGLMRSWMSEKDLKNFRARTVLLVDQFNKAGHNGDLTLGENIGDLVGLTASHYAAFGGEFDSSKKQEHQAFFVQYARAWCGFQRPKYEAMHLKRNPHSLSHARVNEQVKQQVAFKEAFSCKESDPMVLPKEKLVRLW